MSVVVEKYKLVSITYLIKDEDGETIEQNDVPVSYVHGVGSELLPALEEALEGHQLGDVVKVTSPEDAFGRYDPKLTFSDKIDNIPEEYRAVGAEVQFKNDQGETKTFVVSKIEADTLTMDGNHPFAGKKVQFVATIHDIRDASEEEIANKAPAQADDVDVTNPSSGNSH